MTVDLWKTLRNPDCQLCDLHKTAKTVCLLGDGPVPCDLMGIGEAPGEREDDVRKPFQGKAGREQLDPRLLRFGVRRSQIYLSNAAKCRPPDNDTPSIHQIRACREYLLEEIRAVKPKKILAFGAQAIKAVLNDARASVKAFRGLVIHFEEFPDIPVYPCYHPAAGMYDPNNQALFVEDLERALGNKPIESKPQSYHVINDLNEAWEVAKRLTQKANLIIDFETTSLDVLSPDFEILTMGIGTTPGEAYSIACEHPESKLKGQWPYLLQYLVEEADVTIGGHNIKYEIKCGRVYRVSFNGPLRDSLLEANSLDENYPSKSLQTFKRRFFPWMKLEEEMVKHKNNMRGQPLDKLGEYNCEDVDATTRLLKMWKPKLREEGLLPLAKFQTLASVMLADVEIAGMKLDVPLLHRNMKIFADKKKEIADRYPNLNLQSSEQVSNYLYNKLGMRVLDLTDSKEQGSTAKDALERLMGTVKGRNHKGTLEDIITFKKVVHFDSHFITGIFNYMTAQGYIHPSYNMAKFEDPKKRKDVGTVTGRLSASIVHQVPRDTAELDKIFGEDTIQVKEMFISRFEDGCITQADYCLTGRTKVISVDGLKCIKDLVPGDLVLSSKDGKPKSLEFKPVLASTYVGKARVVEITFEDGSKVKCTKDHKWMLKNGIMQETKYLKNGDRLAHVKTSICGPMKYPTWYLISNRNYQYAHQLVAQASLGPKPISFEVDHIDGDISHWTRDNLRYLPLQENHGQGGKTYWREVDSGTRSDESRLTALRYALKFNRKSYRGSGNPNFGKRKGRYLICPVCGSIKYLHPCKIKQVTCSNKCKAEYQRNNHIIKTIKLKGLRDIYQITVKDNHTYVLENGLISGNSQIELRLMAEYSRDANMLKDFESGVDIHTAVTNRLLTVAPTFYSKYADFDAKRKATKMVNFGIIYLISGWALADKLGVSSEDGSQIINSWFKVYPGVKRWLNITQQKIARSKVGISLIGRKRRVPGADFRSSLGREQLRQGVNAPIQGLASDLLVMVMIEVHKQMKERGMQSLLIGNIHDATLVDTHPREREEVKLLLDTVSRKPSLLKELFEVTLQVPIFMDIQQKRTWSKKEED